MLLLPGKEAAARLSGIIHPKYQVHRYSVHLTARMVFCVDPAGELDFAGSEYIPAGKLALGTFRRQPEDRWEWWELARGCYFVEFNETLDLAEDEIALLEPEERLLRAGATHVPMFLRGRVAPIEILLQLDILRLQMKQNARISRLRVFRLGLPVPAASPRRKRTRTSTPEEEKPA